MRSRQEMGHAPERVLPRQIRRLALDRVRHDALHDDGSCRPRPSPYR